MTAHMYTWTLTPHTHLVHLSICSYQKTEGLKHGSAEMLSFDFLLTSVANADRYKNTHSVLAVIRAFGGIRRLNLRDVVNSLSKPTLVILQKV